MLTRLVAPCDRFLARRSSAEIALLATAAIASVGFVDFVTGYEISMSLFYLAPIAIGAWYVGHRVGIPIALLACLSWYIADAGQGYSHPSIPVWNAMLRLGVFLIFAWLLKALRDQISNERRLAQTDSLTGMFGRRAFFERLEHDLALAQRRNHPLSIAFIDLDDFKSVNDTLGHAGGDRVLQTVGRILGQTVRRGDMAARLGGDEFGIILPDTNQEGARRVISDVVGKARAALAASNVTCSIGVITCLDAMLPLENAIAAADALMYQVKRQGKDSVAFSELGGVCPPESVRALRSVCRAA